MKRDLSPSLWKLFPFDADLWPDQIERVLHVLESMWPDNPIDGAIVLKGTTAEQRRVDDRRAYLKARTKTKLCRFTLNNYFSCSAASGVIGPKYYGQMSAGGERNESQYKLMVLLPPRQLDADYQNADRAISLALGIKHGP